MSSRTLQSVADCVAALAAGRPEIAAAYVFGSVASGRTRPGSDIDVAFLLDSEAAKRRPLKYRTDLVVDAGAALETFNVDVVLLNDAPPALAHNVLTKGKLVFERSRSSRIAFQVRNLNRFMDLVPLHQVHLQYLKKRYDKGPVHG